MVGYEFNFQVGNFLIRGISTGEKKRTCIAMELLLEPQILLLDEPTTGLDSFSANEIVNCLTKVANENGRTIIMSLHQPRYSIFKKLDNLTLLTVDGRLAYHGLAKNAKSYFEQRGMQHFFKERTKLRRANRTNMYHM